VDSIGLTDLDREITLHDLMTHTSGLGYGLEDGGPVDRLYQDAKILRRDEPLAEKVKRLVKLPLWHQPGEGWTYSVATDVLGHVIEVIAGVPLDAYLKQRIFEPLGMVDTDFYVPQEKRERLAALYTLDKKGHLTPMQAMDADDPTASDWTEMAQRPEFLSGGGGLVSTAADYLRFGEMLRNQGEWNGQRLLGRKTVALMTMNHLPAGVLHPFENPAMGFGLGVGVLMDVARSQALGSPGTFGWGGAASTDFWVDPKEDMIGLLLLQFMPSGYYPIKSDFKVLAYQALVD
jgi:CubicO group peptidase (beta-lactamase class C family)